MGIEQRKISYLINGFWRSGTTYLYIQLLKIYRAILYEPLLPSLGETLRAIIKQQDLEITARIHKYLSKKMQQKLFTNYYKFFGDKIFDIIKKYHPNRDRIYHFIYNFRDLWLYLRHFKGFHIKEVSLHLYLGEKLIRKYWEPYQIIRHPIDVFMSVLDKFCPTARKVKLTHLQKLHWTIRFLMNKLGANTLYPIAKELYLIYGTETDMKKIEAMSIEDAFIISWTIANYYAVKSLPKDRIIIYEKPETYKRLPFELKDPLKIKIYPKAREDLSYKFEKIAKKWDLDSEYNYLLKLFD